MLDRNRCSLTTKWGGQTVLCLARVDPGRPSLISGIDSFFPLEHLPFVRKRIRPLFFLNLQRCVCVENKLSAFRRVWMTSAKWHTALRFARPVLKTCYQYSLWGLLSWTVLFKFTCRRSKEVLDVTVCSFIRNIITSETGTKILAGLIPCVKSTAILKLKKHCYPTFDAVR